MGYREIYFKENKPVRGKYRCSRCGGYFSANLIDVDHIVPKSRGGIDHPANLQALCQHCNRSKGNDMSHTVSDLVKHNTKRIIKNLFK